jgi:isopentenyl-diphosphate delta-isomerase
VSDLVAIVDRRDRDVGVSDKIAAHLAPGRLHRAFSVFLFKPNGSLLLQRRAMTKYHFADRWSNSCCGHPRPGEDLVSAAVRRTREELGLECELSVAGSMIYHAVDDGTGLVENEFDHVLVGLSDSPAVPAPDEVGDVSYVHPYLIQRAVRRHPHRYTPWLPVALTIAAGH